MPSKNKYSFLERLNIDRIYNIFLGLPPKQQTIAMVAAGFIVFIIFMLPISLASNKITRMENRLDKTQNEMGNIMNEIAEYNEMRSKLENLEKSVRKGFDTSLSTTIENLAEKAGIKENIESIKERPIVPSELFDESIVEVRVSKVALSQLVDFLYTIEYDRGKLLRVKELKMRTRYDNKSLFDVSFQVSTYRLQQEG